MQRKAAPRGSGTKYHKLSMVFVPVNLCREFDLENYLDLSLNDYCKRKKTPQNGYHDLDSSRLVTAPSRFRPVLHRAENYLNYLPSGARCTTWLCCIYTSNCKKAVIIVSHSMSDAPLDQPSASPEQLSSSPTLANGHAVSSNVLAW